MSLNKTAEAIIREAMERGDFANLSSQGKPMDLSAYFETPEEVRMAYSLLNNAGVVPEELNLLQELAALREQLNTEAREEERNALRRKISDKQMQYNLLMERRKR